MQGAASTAQRSLRVKEMKSYANQQAKANIMTKKQAQASASTK
jgi:hypothetical protein